MNKTWRPMAIPNLCLRCSSRATLPLSSNFRTSLQQRSVSLNTAINDSLRSRDRKPRTEWKRGPPKSHQDTSIGKPRTDWKRGPPRSNDDTSISKPRSLIKHSVSHSEFLLGPHSVLAALRLQRRKVLKLYFEKDMARGSQVDRGLKEILRLARQSGIEAVSVSKEELERFASAPGRPHNVRCTLEFT
jgi:hypothetical protein